MESYLVDPTALGEFVDALISAKYPNQPAEKYSGLREEAIKALDHQILKSLIGKLTKEQGKELNQLLDQNDSDPTVFEDFFKRCGIDLAKTVEEPMIRFRDDFMKGAENA